MIKVFTGFAGYGTDNFALKELGVPYELVGFSEIDKYAVQCFIQNHGGKNFGDIKNINPNDLPDFDLFTGGFPCQSFSLAGKRLGELDPRGTLFYEIIRINEVKKPKYMLLENVKGLTCKKFKDTFDKILSELDRIGYNVYWEVLNTKDYGIPQSRARIFFVCIRKDINQEFKFPEKEQLKVFIKDILDENVSDKYYLSPKLQERFNKYLEEKESKIIAMRSCPRTSNPEKDKEMGRFQNIEPREDGCSNSLTNVQKDNLVYDRKGFDSRTKGFRENELSPTLSMKMGTGGNNVPMVLTGLQKHQSIKTDGVSNCLPSAMGEGGGHVPMVANCLDANMHKGVNSPEFYYEKQHRNIVGVGKLRRLTPKECFRLQGFLNDDVNLANLSDTQCYKLAGNGQSVNVVKKILSSLLIKQITQKGSEMK